MRVTILAVGRMRSGPEAILCDDYFHRALNQGRTIGISDLGVKEFAESRSGDPVQRMREEAGRLLGAVSDRATLVAVSERGRQMDSEGFAGFLRDRLDDGTPDLAFLIGGPDGLDREIEERAPLVLSLGAMTWPHRLARAMLAEQIYRSVTILNNHPYHRA